MGQSSCQGSGLTPSQVKVFKLSVSAACRKMTADQVLDLADQLHEIIRKRGACCKFADVSAKDSAYADLAPERELVQ